jgi:ketosteroid isomerase-like protein
MSAQDVLNHHLEAFASGNVEEVMKDYSEDSVLIVPEATLTGLDNISAAFAGFFAGLFKPGTYEFTVDRSDVSGDIAYVVWHSTNQGAKIPVGTDTFLVKGGKIAVQTFAAHIQEG